MASSSAGKAKIAQRVLEVLEYFSETRRVATVMDIARHYNRPQSSTSELLSCLVEQGLLHKDPIEREYMLTPRAALIGTGGHSDAVRDGSLARLTERLVAQAGIPVAVFGKIGIRVNILSWQDCMDSTSKSPNALRTGMQAPLSENAAGWLLLSTLEEQCRANIVRELEVEASGTPQFSTSALANRIRNCSNAGFAIGPAGFGSSAQVVARLLPQELWGQPLALGFVLAAEEPVHPNGLLDLLEEAIQHLRNSMPLGAGARILASAA